MTLIVTFDIPLTCVWKTLTWPLIFTVRDRAIKFRMCVVLNKTFLFLFLSFLSFIWNTWLLTSNFIYVTYWWRQWKQIQSLLFYATCTKATYNDYFSISLLTVSLISLSEEIQYRATCASPFSLVTFLSYILNTIWKCPASATCIPWNSVYIVMYILHLSPVHMRWFTFGACIFNLQLLELLCLAEDHWRGFSTRNAHMVHIVNLIRLKMVYTS